MKELTRQRLSELIVEELAEKIRHDRSLRRKLEVFTDLPVEKVADAMLRQFDYLLSSDLRELILHMIEQEVAQEKLDLAASSLASTLIPEHPPEEELADPAGTSQPDPGLLPADSEPAMAASPAPGPAAPEPVQEEALPPPVNLPHEFADVPARDAAPSIMAHFGSKEPFPTQPMDIDLLSIDWLYVYGFSYAPDSFGNGVPAKKLTMEGIDHASDIFLVDYGDVRFFASKLKTDDYPHDKDGKPTLTSQRTSRIRFEHERLLNILRSEEVVVPLPSWSVVKGLDDLIKAVEGSYVEALRSLIEMHDASEWNVDLMAMDDHLLTLPSMAAPPPKERAGSRTAKHAASKGVDVRKMERVIFREKTMAQEVHNELLIHAQKNRVDYMVRLDSAMMGDWKSILSARYTVGKEKRRAFCQNIAQLQKKYEEFELLFSISSPSQKFTWQL